MIRIKVIEVSGRKWFDRKNGNTYFSAVVNVDGVHRITCPYEYGYGEQYIDAAKTALRESEIIDIDDKTPLHVYCRDNDIILITHAVPSTKRELNMTAELFDANGNTIHE